MKKYKILENFQKVKKTLFIILYITLCSYTGFSQGYFGLSVINKGLGATAGVLIGESQRADIAFNVTMPILEVTNPTVYSLSVGFLFNLSNYEMDNYTITPSVGLANSTYKEIVLKGTYSQDYDRVLSYDSFKKISKINSYFSVELGKDAYLGRAFIKGTYTDRLYYGLGMRIFLNKKI